MFTFPFHVGCVSDLNPRLPLFFPFCMGFFHILYLCSLAAPGRLTRLTGSGSLFQRTRHVEQATDS